MRSARLGSRSCDSAVRSAARLRRAGRGQADGGRHGGRQAEHPDDGADAASTPVNADLDGKVVYLGLDVDHVADRAGQGRHADALLEGGRVARRRAGRRSRTSRRPATRRYINADHAPVKGKYPVSSWKAGEIIRDQHTVRLPRELGVAVGRGLRRALARARRACRSRRARTTPRGACWRRRSRCSAKPRRRRGRASATSRAW